MKKIPRQSKFIKGQPVVFLEGPVNARIVEVDTDDEGTSYSIILEEDHPTKSSWLKGANFDGVYQYELKER